MERDIEQQLHDERFMQEALIEARAAASVGEVPIGAVVVHDGQIIARAHNRRELDEDPSAHAEFAAMVEASRVLGRWRLSGCTVYVTLEPCLMCAGLMVNSRIDRCVYGAEDPKAGAVGSLYDVSRDTRLNHAFQVTSGVLESECAEVLRGFFAARRKERASQAEGDIAHERARVEAVVAPSPTSVLTPNSALPAPRVLIAMDSFKGSATSEQIEAWVAEGARRACPASQVACLPVADGGEGTLAAAHAALGGELRELEVTGPLGGAATARYLLAGTIAIIESAEAAGIALSCCTLEDALRASTVGVGQLVAAAVRAGAQRVYLGLGGSCTSDGGAGFLQALGARLLDSSGEPIVPGLEGLGSLAHIDLAPACAALASVELVALTDVTNPLVGKRGALAVFGPQKGLADPAAYDAAMVSYARLLDAARKEAHVSPEVGRAFRSVAGVPGAGAAGGLGAALLALGARLTSGVDAILELVGFDEALRDVDMVITGEGRIDVQSASGKTPVGVARRAKRLGKPVVAIAGGRDEQLDAVYGQGVDLIIPALREPMPLECALTPDETRRNLVCAGESAMRAYLMGK